MKDKYFKKDQCFQNKANMFTHVVKHLQGFQEVLFLMLIMSLRLVYHGMIHHIHRMLPCIIWILLILPGSEWVPHSLHLLATTFSRVAINHLLDLMIFCKAILETAGCFRLFHQWLHQAFEFGTCLIKRHIIQLVFIRCECMIWEFQFQL